MKPIYEYIPHARADDRETVNHFDIVDRMVVFLFLTISTATFALVLDSTLSESELAEIAPAMNVLPWILLFFMAWPVLRLPLYWLDRAIRKRAKSLKTKVGWSDK